MVVSEKWYLFANCAQHRDNVEKAIVYQMRQSELPNIANVKNVKGSLFGRKIRCLVIKVDKNYEIVVSCIVVGTYLYVSLYTDEIKGVMELMLPFMKAKEDLFKKQEQNAIYVAIIECCEEAFSMLGLKEEKEEEKNETKEEA